MSIWFSNFLRQGPSQILPQSRQGWVAFPPATREASTLARILTAVQWPSHGYKDGVLAPRPPRHPTVVDKHGKLQRSRSTNRKNSQRSSLLLTRRALPLGGQWQ